MSTPDYTDHRKPNVGLSEELDDLAPVGYFTTDSEGVFTRVNKAFLTLCGYASGDLVGQRRFRDLLSRGGQAFHETHYSPMLRLQGRVEAIAFDLVRKDSNRVPILVNAALTGDTIRAAAFDVTERRRYEKQLLLAKEAAVADRQRISDLARALQQTLIPPKPPIIDGLDVAARYRPAGDGHEVGGDFYDVFQVGAQEWVLAIGDVCGKGIAAGIVTSLARHVVREASAKFSDPAQALQALNEVILTEGNRRFCTAIVVRLRRDSRTWTVTISVGGHPLPFCSALARWSS